MRTTREMTHERNHKAAQSRRCRVSPSLWTLAVVVFLGGCSTRAQTMVVQAPHDPQATRTWWVIRDKGGDDHVVLCDTALLASPSRQLCMWWPATAP